MEKIGTFSARDDAGRTYTVVEYPHWIPAGTLLEPNARLPGLKEFRLSTGEALNHVGGDKYEIVRAVNVPLTRI